MKQTTNSHRKQRGAALLTALAFLVIITLISLSAIRTSTLELTMASNEESGADALQSAQSAIDSLLSTTNFPVTNGYVGCYNVSDTTGCTSSGLSLPTLVSSSTDAPYSNATNSVKIALVSTGSFVCRACESSATLFDGAVFTIKSSYDNTTNRGGRATINEGFLMLVPKN